MHGRSQRFLRFRCDLVEARGSGKRGSLSNHPKSRPAPRRPIYARLMRARLLLIKAYFTCQSFIFFFTCLVFRQIVRTQTQKQVISYLTSPPPLSPLPTPFTSSSLSNRYSGQHRDVLVEGMVLEHALGDENVLNLPQHVLAKVAAHDLRVSKEKNK